MEVRKALQSAFRPSAPAFLSAVTALALPLLFSTPNAISQTNPSSVVNPYFGSVTVQPIRDSNQTDNQAVNDQPLKLSLDDAIARGLKNNLGLIEAESGEKTIAGERKQALQEFLPTITLNGDTGYYQHNLAALGFSPSVVARFAKLLPNAPKNFPSITRDDLTEGQISMSQTLFSGPVFAAYKASNAAVKSAYFAKMTARGEVVQQVATVYLRSIAAESDVENAKVLVAQDQLSFDHAHQEHLAGTIANLEELRAKVQLENQQQLLISDQNQLEKDLILLKREIGINPGQQIELTDPAPYSDLAEQTPEELRAVAYKSRQDYQNLQNQLIEYKNIHAAYRSQRWPTLTFSSSWSTETVNGAGTHGVFSAMGTLKLPIFREASLRGQSDASLAQMDAVNAQLSDLRDHIDQQVRAALLDVEAGRKLVEVARSNVDLATRALSDETDRVNAGVDDNLPLVTAQATLASAQTNLVESLYQYNVSKLALARAAGVLEAEYRDYLGR
jgi:outer membrane protein TolC